MINMVFVTEDADIWK